MFSCSKIEQKQLNTWVSFQSAEQPLLGQFSVSGNIDGHAGYVDHYLQVLRNDKKEIFRASRDAERMARYVLSFHPDFREEFEAEHRDQMTAAVAAGAPDDIFDASDFDFEPDLELEGPRP